MSLGLRVAVVLFGVAIAAVDAGTPSSTGAALDVARKGCDAGRAVECTQLGLLYENGRGTEKDAPSAAAAFDKGCRGGDIPSRFYLSNLYAFGIRGVPTNDALDEATLAKAEAAGCRPIDCVRALSGPLSLLPSALVPCSRKACLPIEQACR